MEVAKLLLDQGTAREGDLSMRYAMGSYATRVPGGNHGKAGRGVHPVNDIGA